MFLLYDGTLFKYMTLHGNNIGWTCYRKDAHRFSDRASVEERIKFLAVFSTNAYRTLRT